MGREIRRVPPHYEPPQRTDGRPGYQPQFDRRFEDAAAEWKREFTEWEAGENLNNKAEDGSVYEFWEWSRDPPNRKYYRTYSDEDATWIAVFETVSEGTPVTPAYETKEELVQYLAAKGDYWDQRRGTGGWEPEAARQFVERGWAPSIIVSQTQAGIAMHAPRDGDIETGIV